MKKYSSNQNGRSMIEMLGVLAIVGVLSVAGIAGYSKAMAKYKTNKLIDQVSTVAANVRTTFAGQGNYKGLDSQTAYDLGIYPEETVKDCAEGFDPYSCIHHAMGGAISVYSSDDYSFDLGVDTLSKNACAALVSADWGSASSFVGILDASATRDDPAEDATGGDIAYSASDIKGNLMSVISNICDCKNDEQNCVFALRFK